MKIISDCIHVVCIQYTYLPSSIQTLYTTFPAVDYHNLSISDDSATNKTTAAIAVLACLLFVALSAAVYFASKYISPRKRHEQESARKMKTMEVTTTQDTRYCSACLIAGNTAFVNSMTFSQTCLRRYGLYGRKYHYRKQSL